MKLLSHSMNPAVPYHLIFDELMRYRAHLVHVRSIRFALAFPSGTGEP